MTSGSVRHGVDIQRSDGLLLAVFLAGVALTTWLFFQTRDGVFFVSDGGLKYQMLTQYAAGDFSIYLHDDKPEWVREAWDAGLYPGEPPMVVPFAGGRVSVFPILFQLLTTPFYLLFGFRGLYILPTLALWALWWRFARLLQALKLRRLTVLLISTALIFGTPILLFGAMFWEHTLAVLLTFLGLEFAFRSPYGRWPRFVAVSLGGLVGLSVWLRPEAPLFTLPIAGYLALRYLKRREPHLLGFLVSYAAVTIGFLVVNQLLFHLPLGVHGQQMVVGFSLERRLTEGILKLVALLRLTWRTFPLAALLAAALPVLLIRRRTPAVYLLTTLLVIFIAAVPLFVTSPGGKQWGPRYYYSAFPVVLLLGAYQLEEVWRKPARPVGILFLALFGALTGLGMYKNSIEGTMHLSRDYEDRIRPAILYLRATQPEAVAVGHQVIAQELSVLRHELDFFLTKDDDDVRLLSEYLHEQGICRFALLTDWRFYSPPGQISAQAGETSGDNIRLTAVGSHGEYEFFQVQLDGWARCATP